MPEGFKNSGKSKFKLIFIASIILVSFSVLTASGLYAWQYFLQKDLNSLEQAPIASVNINKINRVKQLLNDHTYWSQVFPRIEKSTLSNLYFNSFSGDSSGKISLQSNVPSYNVLAKQLKAFEQEFGQVDFSIGGLDKQGGLNIEIILNAVKLSKN